MSQEEVTRSTRHQIPGTWMTKTQHPSLEYVEAHRML
uniref:Uncharacterized protein n=1 Tax=Arundo donax TaxID=35708 RepID=A0A0A9G1W6_ARUDO